MLALPPQCHARPRPVTSAANQPNPTSSTGCYELYLALNDIAHRKTKVGSLRTNGFVEGFNGTVLEEFLQPNLRSRLYERVEALQADLWATGTRAGGRGRRRNRRGKRWNWRRKIRKC